VAELDSTTPVKIQLKDVKEGKVWLKCTVKVRTAILVWRDGEGETIARLDCGVVSGASQLMGMLSFASQMIYESAKKS
jgi:hypothetical protein